MKQFFIRQIFMHFASTYAITMTAARFLWLPGVVMLMVLGSGVKEFYFDRKKQDWQGQVEDFVFLAAGSFAAAAFIRCFGVY